jgi:valyl-tRNA synthetase
VFASWLEGGHFHPEATGTPEENYSIAIPPPNVTGALHMGHALNGTIQDALIRMQRMRGRNSLWILGTDHAGIATQAVVEKELAKEGISRQEIGREKFVEKVWEWKEQYGSQIVEQYKRLGASCDYERERFTLDEGYVTAVYRVFTELFQKGLIYRDNYMVNWDPGTQSAISDLEVENREVDDTIYEIGYPLEGEDAGELVVATVRPETMLADTAVAVNPDDERHKDLVGQNVELPLVGRLIPVIADEHVDVEFGTGALKITPGHDPNDFAIGRAHSLAEITVIGEDGRMTDAAGDRFKGMSVADAQEEVVQALRDEGFLRSEEPYRHSVPFSHRSGERIEPLISLQRFCRIDELAPPAVEAVRENKVRNTPDGARRQYFERMESIPPWCISRQLWWGHRIPVWYRGDETYVGEQQPEGEGWEQDPDVLDTWFSSALWPFATLGWPDTEAPEYKAFFPTVVLSTARDIIALWVARMVMMSLEFTGREPFSDVYVHSVIQAPDGRRMSKSLGTGIDPLDEISEHGADALRFGLLAMTSTQDVRYSAARVQQGRDLANKMWNASRLILTEIPDITAERLQAVAHAEAGVRVEDRWILSRLQRAIGSFTEQLEAYDFSHAVLDLYEFFWSELCDWYLEIVKPRLYDGDEDAAANLLYVLEQVLALAHPVMPFITEEIWSYLPDRERELVISPFPSVEEALIDAEAEQELAGAIAMTRALRRWRDLAGVAAGTTLGARGEQPHELVGRLARVEFTAVEDGSRGEPMATVAGVELLATEGVDGEAVEKRIEERREKLRAEVKRGEGKLSNEGFVAKAPAEVVDEERAKLEAYKAELEELS